MEPAAWTLVGVLITIAGGLVGALLQSRREHHRWVRERRLEAYVKAHAVATELASMERDADELRGRVQSLGRAIPRDSVAVDQAEQDADDMETRVKDLKVRFYEANSPLVVLGPQAVRNALSALTEAGGDQRKWEEAELRFQRICASELKISR